jgi:hypothetical protein
MFPLRGSDGRPDRCTYCQNTKDHKTASHNGLSAQLTLLRCLYLTIRMRKYVVRPILGMPHLCVGRRIEWRLRGVTQQPLLT